jgi:hypothetical protein
MARGMHPNLAESLYTLVPEIRTALTTGRRARNSTEAALLHEQGDCDQSDRNQGNPHDRYRYVAYIAKNIMQIALTSRARLLGMCVLNPTLSQPLGRLDLGYLGYCRSQRLPAHAYRRR